jgi:streptomycin 6-kinase
MTLLAQLQSRARQWGVTIEESRETSGSLLGFGLRNTEPVVLKISKQQGDEWHSGDVLRAFEGNGTARVYESEMGAVLLERLEPGGELVELVRGGDDAAATEILAQVMHLMSHHEAPTFCPSVHDWARGFDRYLDTRDQQIPTAIVNEARETYRRLASSQRTPMLLHGDLHHYNVLHDTKRGWLAIDPKGVIGELEYEIGAILRNPFENPDLLTSPTTIERRLELLVTALQLDYQRTVAWSYAQAVLSAIWEIEDSGRLPTDSSALQLAQVLKPMIAAEFLSN